MTASAPATNKAAQIAVTLLADTAEPVLAPLECCFGASPIEAEKLRPERKVFGSATLPTRAVASTGPTPGQSSSRKLISLDRWPSSDHAVELVKSVP